MDTAEVAPVGTKPRRRWGRRVLISLFLLALLVGGSGAALVRSGWGQRVVLDASLSRVRAALAGSLTVDEIRSGNLLTGATLVGVRLDAAGGRRFMEADSVWIRYSLLSLVGAAPRIASLNLFRPRVEISRYPSEGGLNVARLMIPRSSGVDSVPRSTQGLAIGSVEVWDGLVEILKPLEGRPTPRMLTVPAPEGDSLLRRIGVEALAFRLDDVTLAGPDGDMLVGQLVRLSTSLAIMDRPLEISHLEGRVRFGAAGLSVDGGSLRLPESAFDGSLTIGPEGADAAWSTRIDLTTRGPAALDDLRWIDDRFPEGVFRGRVRIAAAGALDVDLEQVRVELEASRLSLDGGFRVSQGVELRDLTVEASPLALTRLEPWLKRDLAMDGWLSGHVRLNGDLSRLSTDGRVTLVPTGFGGRPTTADVKGTLHLGPHPGMTNLHAVFDPLNFDVLAAANPAFRLRGDGSLDIQASGRFDEGIRFAADARHGSDSLSASRVLAQGSARKDESGAWVMDVQGDLSPLSLGLLTDIAPGLAPDAKVSGSIRAVGPLRELRLHGELTAGAGTVDVDGLVDATHLGASYDLEATMGAVLLSQLFVNMPEPSTWTGHAQIRGTGLRRDSLEAQATVVGSRSRLGGLHVDTVMASVHVGGGLLTVDTVVGTFGGIDVQGAGGMGLVEGAQGRAHVTFRTENLFGLRPLLLGDSVVAGDTLSVLEEASLRMLGVDVGALPDSADIGLSGLLEGDLTFTGAVSNLGVAGTVHLRNATYGRDHIAFADVRLDATDVTSPDRVVRLTVDAKDVVAYDRAFAALGGDVRIEGRSGEGSVAMERAEGDRYTASGAIAMDSLGRGHLRVDYAVVELDSLPWHLARPAQVEWDSASVMFTDLEVARGGQDPMRVTATGGLSWNGSSNLRVEAAGLHLDRVARIAEWEGLGLGGHVDLVLDVTGPAARPEIRGSFQVVEPRYGELGLVEMKGDLTYIDRLATVTLEARDSVRRVFHATGTVPVDLALRPEGRRIVQRGMDVTVVADSLDASLALSYLKFLEDVDGVVSGEFRILGSLDAPEPSGVLRLDGGAWTMDALEVRHSDVSGTLTLKPDRSVDVVVNGRAGGTSTVRGRVILDPLADPRLDLTLGFQGFQAVNRRDITGLMSGEIKLVGSYREPRVEGSLTVDRGTIFLEEFVRSTTVVDLTDPRIFDVVDTTALATRPLLAGIRNPFLQNLRVDVDLSVPRDTWLRSEEMNVEMGGSLFMRYDRLKRDVVMVGELQALRGSYSVLGRRFDVESGTIGFIGTPGINPTLAIQAVSRIRRVEGDPLDVTATVAGTLTQPRVSLSTDEQGIAESDMVSYLIFGRPSYELATGQQAFLQGAAGSFVGAGVTYLSGTLATRLGAALSQQIGLDYLSITQAGDFGAASMTLSNPLLGAQVEVGQYIGQNVFFVLIFRPKPEPGTGQSYFGGARVEVALNDDYNVQGFWEDRSLRNGWGGLGQYVSNSQILGVFIFREWGY